VDSQPPIDSLISKLGKILIIQYIQYIFHIRIRRVGFIFEPMGQGIPETLHYIGPLSGGCKIERLFVLGREREFLVGDFGLDINLVSNQ